MSVHQGPLLLQLHRQTFSKLLLQLGDLTVMILRWKIMWLRWSPLRGIFGRQRVFPNKRVFKSHEKAGVVWIMDLMAMMALGI